MNAKKKARDLKQQCKNANKCGDCNEEAMEICDDLCSWDNKTLCDLDDSTIADYLKHFKGYERKDN